MQRNPNLRSSLRGRRRGEFVATNYASRLASRGNPRRRLVVEIAASSFALAQDSSQ